MTLRRPPPNPLALVAFALFSLFLAPHAWALEAYSNNCQTTLNGSLTAIATTVNVTSAACFPDYNNASNYETFSILVDQEYMTVTYDSGLNQFQVIRGEGGSTATTHSSGATVTQLETVRAFNQIKADVQMMIQTGLRPAL